MINYGLKINSPYEISNSIRIDIEKDSIHNLSNDAGNYSFYINNGAKLIINEELNNFKNEINVYLVSENSSVKINSKIKADIDKIIDVTHFVYHKANNTNSEINSNGQVDKNARVILRENIFVEKEIKNINGKQKAKFILFDNTAQVDAIPSMSIYSEDVCCEHSLIIENPSDNLIWYAGLRGIKKDDIKNLFLNFLE